MHKHAIMFLIMFSIVGTAAAGTDAALNQKLETTIAAVRSTEPSEARFNAAMQLADLTHKVRLASISDSTVNDLVSLLDDPDDVVRLWTAVALGNLGRRAKVAIPKLLALLPEAECQDGDWTSAATVRPALRRMGVRKLPPAPSYDDCHKQK
jgi:HEAT repeat protein